MLLAREILEGRQIVTQENYMEGLTNGIVTYTPCAERAMQTAADKIKNCADKTFYKGKTSTFTQHGIDIVKGLQRTV